MRRAGSVLALHSVADGDSLSTRMSRIDLNGLDQFEQLESFSESLTILHRHAGNEVLRSIMFGDGRQMAPNQSSSKADRLLDSRKH